MRTFIYILVYVNFEKGVLEEPGIVDGLEEMEGPNQGTDEADKTVATPENIVSICFIINVSFEIV